jgi:predicted nicotinamide N-methyase
MARGEQRQIDDRETTYDGPVTTTRLQFDGRSIRVVRPADPDRLLDDPLVREWNQRDDYMPYWAYLWPAALMLAEVVASAPWQIGVEPIHYSQALEIGCGLGLAGLMALDRGLAVCFTDCDRAPLHYVRESAHANGFDPASYTTRLLDWRDLPNETYSVILGSDVLYERRLVSQVAGLLAKLLERDGLGLITCPGRSSAEGFASSLSSLGMSCRCETIATQSEQGELIRGVLYRVRWRTDR